MDNKACFTFLNTVAHILEAGSQSDTRAHVGLYIAR
jgi:hypothetical protein